MNATSNGTLTGEDISCPICLDIYIQPITLVCKHELCKSCYEDYFLKADFRCPLCKKRLSTWARRNPTVDLLVNVDKWSAIQQQYPDLVKKRLNGEDTHLEYHRPLSIQVAKQGIIHEEYEEMRLKYERERLSQAEEEEAKSMELINQMMEEEKRQLEKTRQEQIENDEKFANIICQQLNQPSPSPVCKKILRSTIKTRSAKKKGNGSSIKCKSIDTFFQTSPTQLNSSISSPDPTASTSQSFCPCKTSTPDKEAAESKSNENVGPVKLELEQTSEIQSDHPTDDVLDLHFLNKDTPPGKAQHSVNDMMPLRKRRKLKNY
uniref:RING-type E3 ubiquitin transferase n=1 Tax=Ciona intestinalis TaxID=7719 RepID=F7AJS0_CIOIN